MHRAVLAGVLLLVSGCGFSGGSSSAAPGRGARAATLHCTIVLVDGKPQRVCGPRGTAPGESPTPPTDTARASR
jgi:hypothetical protein